MDEPLRMKRNIFGGNKINLCSLFWKAHGLTETEALDSDDSFSISDLPLESPSIDDSGLEQLLQQIVPAEPKEQQLSLQDAIPAGHYEPEALSPLANSDTLPGQEPISPQECTAICPGQESFPPCCTSVEDLGLESSLLQQCSDDKGLNSSSPQHFPADYLKLGLSSMSCCCTVTLGLKSSSLPHHRSDPSDWEPRSAQLLNCNQPTKNPCTPKWYPEIIHDQNASSLQRCSTSQLGQDTCPENTSGQKAHPLYQLKDNSPELGSSLTRQHPVEHLKLEASSEIQEDTNPQWYPTQQPLTEASSETQTADRSTLRSSSPLYYCTETLELNPSSQQSHSTHHLKPELSSSEQCSGNPTRLELSSARDLPLDLNQTDSSPRVVFQEQPKLGSNSSRFHQTDLSRTNSSSQHHLADQSRPDLLSTSHHLTDQLMPDFSCTRHQPVDLPTHEPSSPRHRQADCLRPESLQCHHIANRPKIDKSPRHLSLDQSIHDSADQSGPELISPKHSRADQPSSDSFSPSHSSAADCQRLDSSSPRCHSAETPRFDSSSPRRCLEADQQRSDSSSPKRHSAAHPQTPNSSYQRDNLVADHQRPDYSSPRYHSSAGRKRPDSSSPRHLSANSPRSDSSSPRRHSADPTRSEFCSPSRRSPDLLRPDSSSPRRHSADPSRPDSSSPRSHSAADRKRPNSSSPRRHSADRKRPDSSSPRCHSADRKRPDSSSPRCHSADQQRLDSSSPKRHSAVRQRPDSCSPRCHSADQQRLDSSSPKRHSADPPKPDSSSPKHHSVADRQRLVSSSPRQHLHDRHHRPRTELNSLEDHRRPESVSQMHFTEGQSRSDSSSERHSLASQGRIDTSPKHCSPAKPKPGTLAQKHHIAHQYEPSLKLSHAHCSESSCSSCHLSDSARLKPVSPNYSKTELSPQSHCMVEQHNFESSPPVHHTGSMPWPSSHFPPPESCSDCTSLKTSSSTQPGSSSRRHRSTDKTRSKSDKLPPQCSLDRSRSDLYSLQHIPTDEHKTQSSLLYTQRACGESSVLLSKVKALKENRTLGKQTAITTLPQTNPLNPKLCQGETLQTPAANEGQCEDAVVKPESQIRTYLTESLLICSDEMGSSEGSSLTLHHTEDNAAMKLSESPSGNSWRSSGEPWEHEVPDGSEMTIKVTVTGGQRRALITHQHIGNATQGERVPNIIHIPSSFAEQSQSREIKGKLSTPEGKKDVPGDDTLDNVGMGGRLWRAESWDSLGSNTSSGSNTSMLTLTERVEWNRVLLKERLNSTEPSCPHMDSGKDHSSGSDRQIGTKPDIIPGPLMSDADCDSGVSLQDSEGWRSATPQPADLPALSARQEQAKQLLQKARMKGRSGPLRASHHLLPPPPPATTVHPGSTARDVNIDQTAHQSSSLPDRGGPASGSLSDSSSGDSSSGQQQRRQRGPSPSRVRFEDESARDAEARYQERQQQRQRRVLDSVMLSVGQGPLASKPDLSHYVKGDRLHGGERISKACRRQNCAQAMGHRGCGLGEATTAASSPINLADMGKCSTGGSPATGLDTSQKNSVEIVAGSQSLNTGGGIKEHQGPEKVVEPTPPYLEHTPSPLTSKGSPIWILPSRQRIHTERIRETYIGEVTYVDDVDSALDSTDTSDSGRTDSEEACGVNTRRIGRWGRMGRPINRCALVPSSVAALEVERDPSQVCSANQGFGELTKVGDKEVAVNIAKSRSGAGRKIVGKKLAGGVMIDDSGDLSFPLPTSSDQKHQSFEKGNVLAQFSGQELAASMPKTNSRREKELMERDTPLGSSEVLTTRSMLASEQVEKTTSPQCNISTHIPVPPAGKVPSLVPHRKTAIAGNVKIAKHVKAQPNHSPMQPSPSDSPCIPQSLSKLISCRKNSQPLTSISSTEAQSPCLYPAVTSSVNPGNLQHIASPQSKKERDMLNPSVPERLNNLECISTLELEGHEEDKLSSAAEWEGSVNIQPNHAPVPEGQGHSQASSLAAQKRSVKPQTTAMPVLKGQLSPHHIPGGIRNDKKNQQSVEGAVNEGKPKKSSASGSEGQRHMSRNSKAAKHQKTKIGALSTNNCNNTRMEQYEQWESLPGEARNALDKHIIVDLQDCHRNPKGGFGYSIQDYTGIGANSSEENLPAGHTSNVRQEYGTEACSISRELGHDGGHLVSVGGTLSSTGISLSLMSGCVESGQTMESTSPEAEKNPPKQSKRAAGENILPLKQEDIDPGEEPLPAARKRSGSTSSLKKFFSAIGQKTQQKLGRGRSASLEHIATTATTGEATPTTPKPSVKSESSKETIDPGMKKTPSLQSLKLVTPFRQLRKAASAQNLHSSPGKTDRSSCYLLGSPKSQRASDRKDGNGPRRTFSVEDIGTPDQARTVGRVMEVFPDGTCQLELRRPPDGSFGFCIASGNGRPDTGVYIQDMADARTAKLYAGLLAVGDEILEVNNAKVAGLSLPALRDLIAQAETLSIRLLQQRRPLR